MPIHAYKNGTNLAHGIANSLLTKLIRLLIIRKKALHRIEFSANQK